MKKIFAYALVGVVSAGTTFGLIKYTEDEMSSPQRESIVSDSQPENNKFATYDYKSAGTVTPDFTTAAKKTVNAVVSITNYSDQVSRRSQSNPFGDPFFDQFFRGQQQQQKSQSDEPQPVGSGSGVIISEDGYIVTNNHVIKEATKLEVTLNNQQSYTATVVGTDPNTDIALIKIDESNLPFLSFYNSDNLQIGEWVLAVGNPFGLTSTVTAGIISAKGRGIGILGKNSDHPIESFIQTDAAINPGNSGGALVNTNGHLVGINSAISSPTGSYAGYGFAVPANLVKKIVNDIKNYGMVQRGYIGIRGFDLSNEQQLKAFNKEKGTHLKTGTGIYVTDVAEDSGAEEAGIEEGDIVKKVDGKEIKTFSILSLVVGSKNPGDKVSVDLLRDGKEKNISVRLKDLNGNTKIRTKADLTVAEKLGASFEGLTDKQKVQYGIESGVLISKLKEGSELAQLGMQQGYIILKVNNKKVDSEKDVNKILKNYKGNVSINFVDRYGRIYTRGFTMK